MIKKIKNNWKKIIIVVFVLFGAATIYKFFNPSINNIPKGDYIESLNSPSGNYTLKSYKYSGGATADWTLRVEVLNNTTQATKNIYWNYHEDYAKMEWIDEETVIINGKKLNVHKDKFDFRVD